MVSTYVRRDFAGFKYPLFVCLFVCLFAYTLQVPVIPFSVDNLPMSEAALGIWASLVKLAGTGRRQPVQSQEQYQLPVPPGREGTAETGRVAPVRPLLPPKSGEGRVLE